MITLATLPNATAQEVFTQVKNHLLKQNAKSMDGMSCLYRSPSGLSCAAGCLMSDDEAKNISNARGWVALVNDGIVPRTHAQLIRKLQDIHDTYSSKNWEKRLRGVAAQWKLSYE